MTVQWINSLAQSPTGNDTLQQLSLWENQLTRIPDHISSFRKLSYVNLFGNSIVSVPSGSLVFRPEIQVSFLILSKKALNTIEPAAFKGKCIPLNGIHLNLTAAIVIVFLCWIFYLFESQLHQYTDGDVIDTATLLLFHARNVLKRFAILCLL